MGVFVLSEGVVHVFPGGAGGSKVESDKTGAEGDSSSNLPIADVDCDKHCALAILFQSFIQWLLSFNAVGAPGNTLKSNH